MTVDHVAPCVWSCRVSAIVEQHTDGSLCAGCRMSAMGTANSRAENCRQSQGEMRPISNKGRNI